MFQDIAITKLCHITSMEVLEYIFFITKISPQCLKPAIETHHAYYSLYSK